ncbi:4Fe-4S ferredoxin iron-sulfur binding domain protein [Methylobacterium sp. 4-46]|uniref:SCP2 sterol-binding domain-containing protein n=1 Tax=unclassified Methylobacterium TaxID=2615210 RepID=UPI000152D9FE|nr:MULTISPECIES: SCP2 sterol-binding domain-containing protein [Methylobacterium]ACA17409.1 4Fe-4S ferredoxin iron-sulfur binding domain protein [Methylobacterium sp. 4-46]WFT83095.1 SCP2 sterol-binding domain-containing protein [Methylobacterium nodulans]
MMPASEGPAPLRAVAGGDGVVPRLRGDDLLALARACGADDCGLASITDPALREEVPSVTRAFPAARTLLALVGRMHREPVRSPARSVANLEFHSSGHDLDGVARRIVRRLEDSGIRALNPAMAFPMEVDDFPARAWVVSHKRFAEAAGLGRMGLHRSLIHPRFGSFVLLNTVLIAAEVDAPGTPLDVAPCVSCKLCVAACPVGALKPDGAFDFSACLNHNYQQFMGGFANFVEDIAESRSAADYRAKHGYAETVTRWQSLSYGPTYNAAYCIAVCPAGEDVIGPYLADKAGHLRAVVDPLKARTEPVYVVRGSDAAAHAARRFPHKRLRFVRQGARATTVQGFLFGMPLTFQPGRAGALSAVYHFAFTGREAANATVTIRDRRITVAEGHLGRPDLRVTVEGAAWLRFLNREVSLLRLLATGRLRLRGSPRLLAAFGRCFPA